MNCGGLSRDVVAGSRENYPAVNAIFPAVRHYLFLQNVFKCRRLLFIYFVCLHLHCCLTGTERFVNTPFCDDRIIRIASSILQAQGQRFRTSCMRNNERKS